MFNEAARNTLINEYSSGLTEESFDRIVEQLEKVQKAGHYAYESLVRLMEELRDPTLRSKGRDSGLVRAVKEFGKNLELDDQLIIDIDPTQERELDIKTSYVLYRIAQEAIVNACKHAQIFGKDGGHIEILLKQWMDNHLALIIRDNGQGFVGTVEELQGHTTSFGLRQMARWAKQINGDLIIESGQEGTEVRVTFTKIDQTRES